MQTTQKEKKKSIKQVIQDFQTRIRREGRTFKWFHKTYIKDISYVYFMIQLHDQGRLHDSARIAIENFMKKEG